MSIKAAFSSSSQIIPIIRETTIPAVKDGHVLIDVIAAGYSNLVKGRARGAHYSSDGKEAIVGFDGVGKERESGRLVYFFNFAGGAYAETVSIPQNNIFPLPAGTDEETGVKVAALANGAVASILAFQNRIKEVPQNATVAILGVTGLSGRLAVQISKNVYGVKKVIGIGRTQEKVDALKEKEPLLDEVIGLDKSDEELKSGGLLSEVDIVLDFLWGTPATKILNAMVSSKKVSYNKLTWVQIGQASGSEIDIPASYLRSVNLEILGSGLGPQPPIALLKAGEECAKILAEGTVGKGIPFKAIPLSDIAAEWEKPISEPRPVFLIK
ncbi:uncharacterized protein PRCAT00006270001 [Priceomyces carsonii]|uniref:uncharacterized protein n=1 Tax=Priceomyces carsonii TaxID=28549 RepID=UPI002ED83340|nr:unnamed protein product [Priceomyces carsonii]